MNDCKRMRVTARGRDALGNTMSATNGNTGECTGEQGRCGCTHAEINLLAKMPNPVEVTLSHSPCLDCAKALVAAGVRRVYFWQWYRLKDGIYHLSSNGVVTMKVG